MNSSWILQKPKIVTQYFLEIQFKKSQWVHLKFLLHILLLAWLDSEISDKSVILLAWPTRAQMNLYSHLSWKHFMRWILPYPCHCWKHNLLKWFFLGCLCAHVSMSDLLMSVLEIVVVNCLVCILEIVVILGMHENRLPSSPSFLHHEWRRSGGLCYRSCRWWIQLSTGLTVR